MPDSAAPPSFTSSLFPPSSSATLFAAPAASSSTSDWPGSALFAALSQQLKVDAYQWDVLLAIQQLILRDSTAHSATAADDGTAAGRSDASHTSDEEEEDDEDGVAAGRLGSGTAAAAAVSGVQSAAVDDLLASPSRRGAVDPLSSLPPSQCRAFQCLAALIREHCTYLPATAPLPQRSLLVTAADEVGDSNSADREGGSGGEASDSAVQSAPPIARPRNGDVLGLFLVSLLLASPSTPFAQSVTLLFELLGSLTNLRLATRALLDATQRPLHVQLPPNLAHTPLEQLDLSAQSKQTFVTPHLAPSALLPLLLTARRDGGDAVARLNLRPLIYRLLSAVLTQSVASVSPLTSLALEPALWYQFTDTPLFPKVSKVLPPDASASAASSASAPSIHTHGYTWHTWLSLTGRRDAPNNVFRFFNDTGFGVQVHVKADSLAVRTLPNTAEAVVLKGGELSEGEWVHVAVTHKPLARLIQPAQATPVPGRRAFPATAPPVASAVPPPSSHSGLLSPTGDSPTGSGPHYSLSSPMSLSPPSSAVAAHSVRPGRFTLYLNGQCVSVSDVAYPNLEQSDNLQCTLGGLYGRMAAFYLLADVLPADVIASLHAVGAQQFAVPAMHVLHAGLIAVFPPPPSATPSTLSTQHPPAASAAAVVPNVNRTVARCLMAQTPAQTTHSVCLPATWTDDSGTAAPAALTPLTQPAASLSSSINQCLHHTLRLDGTTVVYRTHNAQTLSVLGGLKLLVLCTSPSYCGAAYSGDEELCELLLLLAGLALSSESHAHLLLEMGAATLKQLYLDHCKRRHRTVRLLAAVRRLLLAVSLIDRTADRTHFAAFTSAFLLDFSFWGHSALPVQAAAVRLLHALLAAVPAPFLSFASLGVARVLDNVAVLNFHYVAPPSLGTASSSVAHSTLTSPTHAAAGGQQLAMHGRESSVSSSSSLTISAESAVAASADVSFTMPSAEESAASSSLLDVALQLARSTLSSPTFERDAVAPFLHLIQSCLASPAASVHRLLLDALNGLLSVVALDSERVLAFLHSAQLQAHYVFLRLLYSDAADIRCAGLRLLASLNVHLVRRERLERDKKLQVEYNQLQADIAQAIIAALRLYAISEQEHALLWDILMGQPPKQAQTDSADGGSGQSMEAGVAFCHPAYLSMVLELTLLAPLASQSKVLVDVLTLLRTNSSNVDGLAALFWQRLLLPFSSRMHHNPALAQYAQAAAGSLSMTPTSSSPPTSPSTAAGEDASGAASVTPHTIDQLVVQIVNVMLLNCLLNDPKGWQVLDQCLWCLSEQHSALANMPPQVQTTLSSERLTLARSVHDTWLLEVSILQRLTHTFSRHLKLLAGRRTDSVAAFKDSQVNNLRLNMQAVLELTEWVLFHSPCSFLTAPTLLALGVPDADKLPVATRADNTMDEATRDEAIRDMLKANRDSHASAVSESTQSADSDELPGGSQARGVDDGEVATSAEEESSTPQLADGGGDAPSERRRSLSTASTSSLSSVSSNASSHSSASTASSHSTAAPATSSATILRASQRSTEEPLSGEEVVIFSVLLSALVEHYPMPDKRQDVLRIAFRYLMIVLPHPLCAPLTAQICDMTRVLFCERVTERVEKNTRLVALSLSLLKAGMEAAMKRRDADSVALIKRCIGQLYLKWGPAVFDTASTAPTVHQAQWAAPAAAASAFSASTQLPARGVTPAAAAQAQARAGGDTIALSPSAASATSPTSSQPDTATSSPTAVSTPPAVAAPSTASANPSADAVDEACEAALLRLYQGAGRAVMSSTQNVFLQHQQRFSYLSEVRAAKVNASIVDYLRRLRVNEANREKKFSRGSTVALRQQGGAVQAGRAFLLQHYSVKRGRPMYRLSEKDERQSLRVNKALRQFRGQVMNSRPLPLPLPPPHPDLLRSHLNAVKAALDARPPPPAYPFASSSSLSLLLSHSRLLEYWKLDSTEAPTRMRKLLKKNFTSGDPHTFASANATANAYKRMEEQLTRGIDLTKVKLTAAKADDGSGSDSAAVAADQTAVAAEAEEDREKAAKLLAEADDDDAGEDEYEEGAERAEAEADEDDVDDADDGSGAKVRRSGKVLLAHFATLITPTHKFVGILRITQTAVSFSGVEHSVPLASEAASQSLSLKTASDDDGGEAGRRRRARVREKHIRWSLRQFRIVFPRHFLLRESALEFFLSNFKNYFFHFTPLAEDALPFLQSQSAFSPLLSSPVFAARFRLSRSGREQRNEVYRLLCRLLPDMQFELSPGRRLLKSGLTKQWQRGEVSNFDYLMHLNTLAGRSYNDINQYPVFPWVLADYKSDTIDLNDPSVYRDLSKPIGALNEDRFEIFNERYQSFEDESIPPFLYGSHYSSAGIALHYLIRCEPFTTLAIQLQGGRFDLPDRLFDSVATSWDLSYNNMADVKELIPEFFYLPEIFRNVNALDLGTKQDHTALGDVVLPPWAATPDEFVRINREALESDYVSAHLHEWVDLIFGFKQRGRPAHDAQNVFFYLTYAGSVDIDAIDNPALRKATEDQIANFGQTPIQLLTTPHPRRLSAAERSRSGPGHIQLPQRLPASYTSQLVCNYQTRSRSGRRRSGQQQQQAAEERVSVTDGGELQSILARVPRVLCFTQHDIVVAVDPSMGVQNHSLVAFLSSPPSLLYPAHEQLASIWKPERDEAAVTAAGGVQRANGAAATDSMAVSRLAKDVRLINRRGAGHLVDTSAPVAPSAAQFVPGSVVSSHLITPMCPHWFLSPTPLPSALPSPPATPATSSSSAEQKSRALAPHSGSELYHRLVCVPARSARYLFSGGYFDGSLKVHSLLHGRAHIEGEGGMGGGQQSQHVMAALAAKGDDPLNLQRPAVRTQNILDCRPLSSVRQHRAVVSALHLSSNSAILLSGDEEGVVCMWRTYLDRQEKTRPPIASVPLATFAVHEGPVLCLDSNTVIGIAVSLAQDEQRTRGCDVAVHSIRGGAARFMHNVLLHDSAVDLKLCALTATANIVLYGVRQGEPTLWLYSLNGSLLCSTPTNEVLSALHCTPTASRTVNANDGFVVTGGRRGQVVFRHPHNLQVAQTFFTDDHFPHSTPHGLSQQPTALPVAPAGSSASSTATTDTTRDTAAARGETSADSAAGPQSSSSSPTASDDWTLVESKQSDSKRLVDAAQRQLAANARQYPADALLESIYRDSSLSVQMGVAAVDVSRSGKQLVVSVLPDPDLVGLRLLPAEHPLAALYSADSQLSGGGGSSSEGRLLLFSLPFSAEPQSFLGFYVDYASHTLDVLRDSVSDAMFARIVDSRDSAIEAQDRARDRMTAGGQQANRKVAEVGKKVFGALNSIFGAKQKSPSAAASGNHSSVAAQANASTGRGGSVNAPVARAVPRHTNM